MRRQTHAIADRGRSWRWSIFLAAATLVAFGPILRAGFVLWDDPDNFTRNANFGGLSLAGLRWAWTVYQLGVYQPLGWMLLQAQYSLWGLHPAGYHAVSLAMHAANAVALYALARALLRRLAPGEWVQDHDRWVLDRAAVCGAALFALHPLRVQAVAWVSCQTYLPSVFFAMLATLAYLHAHPEEQPDRPRWVIVSWLCFVVAVLCKAVAATVPALLIILDIYPLRRIGPGRWFDRRIWLEKLGFLATGLVFMAIAVRARAYHDELASVSQYGVEARLAQSAYGVGFYLTRTMWPTRLSIFYPLPEQLRLFAWPFSIAALAVLAITAAALLLRRRWPGLLAAWLAYLVILAPNLGIVRIGSELAADRYAYMASIPLMIVAAWFVSQIFRAVRPSRWLRGVTALGALACLAILGALTWEQCRTWETSSALWTHADAVNQGWDLTIRTSLAAAMTEAGRGDEGAAIFREILTRVPDDPLAHYNLGVYLVERGHMEEAEFHFRAALVRMRRWSHLLPDTHYNLGCILRDSGRLDEAAAEFREASRLNPRDPAIHNNLGVVLLRQDQHREAEACFERALRLDPRYTLARRNRDYVRQMRTSTNHSTRPDG